MDLKEIEERGPLFPPWFEKVAIVKEGAGTVKPRMGSKCGFIVTESSSPLPELSKAAGGDWVVDGSDEIHHFLLDACLKTMLSGEVATFAVKTDHFKTIIGDISPDANVEFTVTVGLNYVERKSSIGSLTEGELLEAILDLKSRGVALYAQKRVYLAFRRFSKAMQLTVILLSLDLVDSRKLEVEKVKAQLYSNIALIFLHASGKDEWALELTNRGISLDPTNVKLLYRRGWAQMRLQNFDLATADFERVLQLDPGNHAALEKLSCIKADKKADDVRMGNAMKKLFGSSTSVPS